MKKQFHNINSMTWEHNSCVCQLYHNPEQYSRAKILVPIFLHILLAIHFGVYSFTKNIFLIYYPSNVILLYISVSRILGSKALFPKEERAIPNFKANAC